MSRDRGQPNDKAPDTALKPYTRVRYLDDHGIYTQRGQIIDLARGTPGNCDCGTSSQEPQHEAYFVKWDNGTKGIAARCHLTTNPERIKDADR
jgi:hypothetical protein